MENTSTFRQILSLLRYLFWISVPVLLWLALRSLEFDRVLQTLTSLKLWQIGLLILSNSFIIFLFGLRWWLLIHRTHQDLAPLQMAGYWLAGFGVDYSTPAPGVGGEPLLAALLHERDGLKISASIAAVAMDRLLDAMINAAVLLAFSLLVMRWQIFHHHIAVQAALVPAVIFILLAIVLFPLVGGHRPFHWLGQ